jgi:C-terminal peptidase prc
LAAVVSKCSRLGMKGMVLDLRFNPGGMLSAALQISDLFVKDGLLLTVKPRVGQEEEYYDQGYGNFTGFPMAVLINGSSASASEIVSACLQDHYRATVIGERSYGKGSVQTIEPFADTKGEFKFTTARYFPPKGRNIDKHSTGGKPEDEWGVLPNEGFEVKLTREERTELAEHFRDLELLKKPEVKEGKAPFKDKQLEKALEFLKKKIGEESAKK